MLSRARRKDTVSLPSLDLALAAKGFDVLRAVQWSMAMVVAGALVSAAWFWLNSRSFEAEAARYEQAKERVQEITRQFVEQAGLAGINVSETRLKALPREVTFANQLLEKRAFSWTRFLSDLEEAVPPHISISSVTLNFKDSTITLSGAALSLKDLTALVGTLETHPAFKEVVLSQHRLQEDDPAAGSKLTREKLRTIDFSLSVAYRPPS